MTHELHASCLKLLHVFRVDLIPMPVPLLNGVNIAVHLSQDAVAGLEAMADPELEA